MIWKISRSSGVRTGTATSETSALPIVQSEISTNKFVCAHSTMIKCIFHSQETHFTFYISILHLFPVRTPKTQINLRIRTFSAFLILPRRQLGIHRLKMKVDISNLAATRIKGCLAPMRTAKVRLRRLICDVWSWPLLFVHIKNGHLASYRRKKEGYY